LGLEVGAGGVCVAARRIYLVTRLSVEVLVVGGKMCIMATRKDRSKLVCDLVCKETGIPDARTGLNLQ